MVVTTTCVAGLVLASGGSASARPPPLPRTTVSFSVQAEPVQKVLKMLADRAGLEVVASERLQGAVSGVFNGELSAVYSQVAAAAHVLGHYDGRRLYVYAASEERTREFGASDADSRRILAQVTRAGLSDTVNRVTVQGGRLTAVGAPRFLEQVAELAAVRPNSSAESRAAPAAAAAEPEPQPEYGFRVFALKYAWATDLRIRSGGQMVTVPGVASIVRSLVSPDGTVPRASSSAETIKSNQPGLLGAGMAANDSPAAEPPPTSLGAGLSELFSLARNPPPRSAPPPPAAAAGPAASRTPEPPRIEADARLNAVVIRDIADRLDAYEPLIRALDREPDILEIEATIIDLDLDQLRSLGIRLEYRGADGDAVLVAGDSATNPLASGQGVFVSAVLNSGSRFLASLQALERKGVVKIVSRPLVVTLSDVEATFENSQTFYVPVAGSLSTDLFNVVTGTTLRVTPHVARDGGTARVRLLVQVEDGSLTERNVGALPVVQNSRLNTQAIIFHDQSLLIGGMVTQGSSVVRGGIPGLSNAPLAGPLFRSKRTETRHTERLFLITPRLHRPGQAVELAGAAGLGQGIASDPPPLPTGVEGISQ